MLFKAIFSKKKRKKQNKLILYLLELLYRCSFRLFRLIRIPTTLVSKKQNLLQKLHKVQATLKYINIAFSV